jgi:hypothetical protein
MENRKYTLAAVLLMAVITTPARAALSIADGDWTSPSTWEGGAAPDQSANGGNGEEVFVSSDITVPTGVDFVSTTTIDSSGNPVDGNLWILFDTASPLGSSLTIQNGARVGTKFWTLVRGGSNATVDIQSGGEFVTAGIDNDTGAFVVNVEPGGTLTFDASIHPNFTDVPNTGFYRGNVSAGTGTNSFNIEGRLNVVDIDNSNVGSNSYTLIGGGVINEVPFAGQAIGINSPGSSLPDGAIDYDAITVNGSGTVTNAFGGGGITNVPAGLTIDIADQTVLDADGIGDGWSTWITNNGGNPAALAGPRRAPIGAGDVDMFTGSGTIQFDMYGFEVNDQSTPEPGDDTISGIFNDQLYNGPGSAAESTFNGTFEIGYVGPEISDDLVTLVNGSTPAVLLINGATNGSFFDNLAGLTVPDQVWSDGTRQFDVTFSDTFFFDLGPPFPVGTLDTRLLFTTLESITPRSGGLEGDYNNNGTVDAADYVVWRDNLGAPAGTLPNDPNGGVVGTVQYDTWKANFGNTIGGGSSVAGAVPEPSALSLLALGSLAATVLYCRRG